MRIELYYKNIIKSFLQKILTPDQYIDFLIWKRGAFEPEIELLKQLIDSDKLAIDVGASDGIYTTHLYKLSKMCYAFEPRVDAFERLLKIFRKLKRPIKFDMVALSNFNGTTMLKTFPDEFGRSTIEDENDLEKDGAVEAVEVKVCKMDDYNFNGQIGFIKIDVEGHEESVLRGAQNILTNYKPNLLIEIEDRHKKNAITSIISYLNNFSYKGFFYKNKKLVPIEKFQLNVDQVYENLLSGKEYYNNFVFLNNDTFLKLKDALIQS